MEIQFLAFLFSAVVAYHEISTWQNVEVNNNCKLNQDHIMVEESGVYSLWACARLCDSTFNCILFQYDSSTQTCSLSSRLVPYQSVCEDGYPVRSFRRYKKGCSGPGYVYNNVTGLCVYFTYKLDSKVIGVWSKQDRLCKEQGGELMIVDTLEKLRFLQDVIKSSAAIGRFTYFIGGQRVNGTYKWINGEDMPLTLDFWRWDPLTYGPDRDCVALGNSYFADFKIYADTCRTGAQKFCEIKLN